MGHELFARDPLLLELRVCLLNLLLEVNALKSFLAKATPLSKLFGTSIKVQDKVREDETPISSFAPVEVEAFGDGISNTTISIAVADNISARG